MQFRTDNPGSWHKYTWKHHVFPFLQWKSRISKQTLRGDLLAGLTGVVIALPQGAAFAAIAGMPPQYGLYSGMIPAIIAALCGALYFGAINHSRTNLRNLMEIEPHPKNLLLIGSGINFIDMERAEFLPHLAKEREEAGGHLYFYAMKEGVCSRFTFLEYLLDIGTDNIFTSRLEAISEIYNRLDRTVCDRCNARIFLESKREQGR